MAFNDYHITARWRVMAPCDEVYDILTDTADYARWWPAAFTDALQIQPGDASGVDRVDRFESRSWLPFSLLWHANVVETARPRHWRFEAWGDLEGPGSWRFKQNGVWCDIDFDWQVRARKPVMRLLSPLLKPLFVANFQSYLRKGESSLRLEIARRHYALPAERLAALKPPPLSTIPSAPLLAGIGALIGLTAVRRRR